MKKLRESAEGKDCQLKIYPYCNSDPGTVVLCHFPSILKGMGKKSPDWWGAYGCSSCHDLIDKRTFADDITDEVICERMMYGLFRTLLIHIAEGRVVIDERDLSQAQRAIQSLR